MIYDVPHASDELSTSLTMKSEIKYPIYFLELMYVVYFYIKGWRGQRLFGNGKRRIEKAFP
jgi:hypothetical protein